MLFTCNRRLPRNRSTQFWGISFEVEYFIEIDRLLSASDLDRTMMSKLEHMLDSGFGAAADYDGNAISLSQPEFPRWNPVHS